LLANVITVQNFNSVTMIDPAPIADLQAKSPALWNRLGGAPFVHLLASSADALEGLRT